MLIFFSRSFPDFARCVFPTFHSGSNIAARMHAVRLIFFFFVCLFPIWPSQTLGVATETAALGGRELAKKKKKKKTKQKKGKEEKKRGICCRIELSTWDVGVCSEFKTLGVLGMEGAPPGRV